MNHRNHSRSEKRPAFSLLELLVVVAILAVVVSLVTVGVQRARATADRLACAHNLRTIGVAALNYHVTHKRFPTESGDNPSFYKSILPYVEGNNAADSTPIKEYLCPARRSVAEAGAKRDFGYVGSAPFDPRSVSILDAPGGVSLSDLGRGGTGTFLLTPLWMDPKHYGGGDPTDLGWSAKQNARRFGTTAKPDGDPTGSIHHLGGPFPSDLPVLFADGHVEWLAYLAYADRWSVSTSEKGGSPTPTPPTGRTVVRITVPNNTFDVEFVVGPEPGENDPPAGVPGK